jgi:hypothetical protein
VKYQYASINGTAKSHSISELEKMPPKMIYASFKPQDGQSIENAIQSLNSCIKHWMISIVDDQHIPIAVDDLYQLDPIKTEDSFYIPFCALVKTETEFFRFATRTINAYLHYHDQPEQFSIENHQGYFAINSQDQFWSNRICDEDWKHLICKEYVKTTAQMENERAILYRNSPHEQVKFYTKAIF